MKVVIFGLAVSSSWGNGHATLWRGLFSALRRRGHSVVFFEKDTPYYASSRDYSFIPGGKLIIYNSWADVRQKADAELRDADVAIVTSYCPDALNAEHAIGGSSALRVFYDMDTGVTLDRLSRGEVVDYIGPNGLAGYELVLSYTGGRALDILKSKLGATKVAAFYGWVDPSIHSLQNLAKPAFDLNYLGTYAADRQRALAELMIEPARQAPKMKFCIGGSMYPADFPWRENISYLPHIAPEDHSAFYANAKWTLNITRAAMASTGWCPQGRLFEAAACGTPIISDYFRGLDEFFEPGTEIAVCRSSADVLEVMRWDETKRSAMVRKAYRRVLAEHTAEHRAEQFEQLMQLGVERDRSERCGV